MGTDRRRSRARSVVGLAAGAATSILLAAVPACLPDLVAAATSAATPGAPDVLAIVPPSCGDGVIDSIENGGATNEECDPGDAGSIGCTADCKLACDGGALDAMGHCYFVVGEASSFRDGQNRCADAGGHIVTFASDREASFVRDRVDGGFWVGLAFSPPANAYTTPSRQEPGWPSAGSSCAGCFAVGADDAGRFLDDDAGADCVLGGGDRWANHACFDPAAPVTVACEREPAGQRIYFCGGPNCTDLPATSGVKRYVIPTNVVTADEATAACAPYDGGSVVVLDSREEREQLVRELVNRFPPPITVWIGLAALDGGALWNDGDAGRPLPWASGEPAADGPAFLGVADPGSFAFDTQLAHVDGDRTARRLVVCQRK